MEINIVPKFLDNALTPVAKEAGEALSDLINLARSPLIKARKVRDLKLQKFLQDLDKELNLIPEEKIIEPPLAIIGPALEDLFKYYMEEDHIVEAFKKLISGAMNVDTKSKVLPSYFERIKQMTELDAFTYKMLITNKRPEVFTGFVKVQDIFTGAQRPYHIAFWDDPPKKESDIDFDLENKNDTWNLAYAEQSITALHTLKILGLVDTERTNYNEEMQYDPNTDGYLNARLQSILKRYRNIFNLDFYLYRERIILYYLTDYGRALGELLSE